MKRIETLGTALAGVFVAGVVILWAILAAVAPLALIKLCFSFLWG